ncbi:hypothetical protein [Deinococcus peraridilitoris]|uniref:hypothetical protein n=1 Tax=Deinococcus peraridilitoris TaxID=432329 RepID=UPI0009FD78A2|nr:hypothetical protein [Deinococcus peraridilitoris]
MTTDTDAIPARRTAATQNKRHYTPQSGGTHELLEPVQLGTLTLPNRIAMAPMTRSHAFDTIPTP